LSDYGWLKKIPTVLHLLDQSFLRSLLLAVHCWSVSALGLFIFSFIGGMYFFPVGKFIFCDNRNTALNMRGDDLFMTSSSNLFMKCSIL
jgi:hypothetical protein